MKNGLEEYFILKDNKKLRYGYTTGSCAAAAAQAAVRMVLSKEGVDVVRLSTPKGIVLFLEPVDVVREETAVSCAIQKDAGDDPDVTNGLLVYAKVALCEREGTEGPTISIHGGEGIGIVTKPGLEQPVGAPAINRVPREMIQNEVLRICEEFGYKGGVKVTISAPGGEALAKKTFNPRLGIEGGISILGTSGIVEPMSEAAIVSTIALELKQKGLHGGCVVVTPGNYGQQYLEGNFPFSAAEAVKCSNYVGQTIDLARNQGIPGLLFVAHIGKFVKVAGGIMNTHSKEADARMEILAAIALQVGADADTARRILGALTTDEGLRVVKEAGLWKPVCELLLKRVHKNLCRRAGDGMQIGVVLFSNIYGELGRTENIEELLKSSSPVTVR